MEIITISSRDLMLCERETIPLPEGPNDDVTGLYPDAIKNPSNRPFRFDKSKKVVVFTCRVHPGETPGSLVLNGAIDLITDLKSE